MSDNELKPCPYCGQTPIYVSVDGYKAKGYKTAWVKCSSSASLDIFSVDAWNNRPIEEALLARIAALEAMLDLADKYFVELGDVAGYEFDQVCADCGAEMIYDRSATEGYRVDHKPDCEVAKLMADLDAWRKARGQE